MANRLVNTTARLWPTPAQELLLSAAILPPERALAAFSAWHELPESGVVDIGSYRVLPLVYRNLHDHVTHEPHRTMLRNVYRREWVASNALFRRATPAVDALHTAGIPVMLLKGAALIASVNDDVVRPMNDLDLLVRAADLRNAEEALAAAGFTSQEYWMQAQSFIGPTAHSDVDLHVAPLLRALDPGSHLDMWQDAVPAVFMNRHVLVPTPAAQLVHACVHGLQWHPIAPMRWIPDAHMLMTMCSVDWDAVKRHSIELRVTRQMADGLAFMKSRFGARVPQDVLDALESAPRGIGERLFLSAEMGGGGSLDRAVRVWQGHRRLRAASAMRSGEMAFRGRLRRIDKEIPRSFMGYLLKKMMTKYGPRRARGVS